jgi:hypothetical protein
VGCGVRPTRRVRTADVHIEEGRLEWARVQAELEARSSTSEDEVDDHQADDDIQRSTTVIADAGTHVIATTTDHEQHDNENEYERHAGV